MRKFYSMMSIALGITLLTGCGNQNASNAGSTTPDHLKSKSEKKLLDKDTDNQKDDNKSSTQSTNGQSEKSNSNHSSDQKNPSNKDSKDQESTKSPSPHSVMQKAMQSLSTSVPKMAPTQVPLEDGKYLSAATKSDHDSYNVILIKTSQPIKINDASLNEISSKNYIAAFGAKKYQNINDARKKIGDNLEIDHKNLDLGNGIKASSEGGLGHNYIQWNEGRWRIEIDSPNEPHYRTENYQSGEELARKVVSYLNNHTLPVPHENGVISISTWNNNPGTTIEWQNHHTVYNLKSKKDPIDALEMATSMKSY